MPIYDFECTACGERFEELCKIDARPPCPVCGEPEARRLLSQVAEIPRLVQSSGTKRRSDNARRVERERRQERQAQQRRAPEG
jgi:putative FmdB family regulatory protein